MVANAALILLFTEFGLTALFATVFAFVIASFSGTTLLAVNLLYPEAITFAQFSDLLLLVLSTSLASTFLLLWLEEPVVRVSRRSGLDQFWTEIGFVFVCGVVTALLLALEARLMPNIELTMGAAFSAGLIGVFAFHFVELFTIHTGFAGGGSLGLLEDEQPDRPDTEAEEAKD